MTVEYLVGSLLFAVVALLGMAWPVLSRRPLPRLEPVSEDEPVRDLVRSLRALAAERREGEIAEEDYEALREAAEARAARALAAEEPSAVAVTASPRTRLRLLAALLVVFALVGATVPALRASVRARGPGGIISGDAGPGASARGDDPLAGFEDRVRRSPDDIAARLDLAHRFLDAGKGEQAVEHYLVVLGRDAANPEALAHIGLLLFQSGRPDDGIMAVDRALQADARYPEALLFKGLILLKGKKDPGAAASAFEAYLEAAPFGSSRQEAETLLKEARAAAGRD